MGMNQEEVEKVSLFICKKCSRELGKWSLLEDCPNCRLSEQEIDIHNYVCDGDGSHFCSQNCREQFEAKYK
jgi:hypothetical protein